MDFIRININQAKPGMIVAEGVYNDTNQLIVPADTVLTDRAIARIRFHDIFSFKVVKTDDEIEEYALESVDSGVEELEEATYFEKLRDTEEFHEFNRRFDSAVVDLEQNFSEFINGAPDERINTFLDPVKTILSSCKTGIQVFDLLHCLRDSDDLTYAHSVSVSLICSVIGSWLNYSKEDIDLLMLAGITHDIGKLAIPKEILTKPNKLTPEEFSLIKTHTMRGYNYLRTRKIDSRIKLAAMMHHERCDGSGYPLGIKGDQIDEFAKIVAIADVYEAMTSSRVYRAAMCPFEVIRTFESGGLAKYDTKILMTFLDHICMSYLGQHVRLNDGSIGTVILINKNAYAKPTLQMETGTYLDMSKDAAGRSIIAIL